MMLTSKHIAKAHSNNSTGLQT